MKYSDYKKLKNGTISYDSMEAKVVVPYNVFSTKMEDYLSKMKNPNATFTKYKDDKVVCKLICTGRDLGSRYKGYNTFSITNRDDDFIFSAYKDNETVSFQLKK